MLGTCIASLALAVILWAGGVDSPSVLSEDCPEDSPETIMEVVEFLDQQLPKPDKERIKVHSEDEYGVALHMGLGMWIRNHLGLWRGCPLTSYFRARGVEHPDHMSGAILDVYWRHLHGIEYDTEVIIECYRDWEAEQRRLKTEAESRGSRAYPIPEFRCPTRESIYGPQGDVDTTGPTG